MSVCSYIRMSTTFRGKRDFLGPYLRYRSNFFVQIPLINEHLFCKYFVFLSVGNATKLCYLWMVSSLFFLWFTDYMIYNKIMYIYVLRCSDIFFKILVNPSTLTFLLSLNLNHVLFLVMIFVWHSGIITSFACRALGVGSSFPCCKECFLFMK